mmetsp:Transcript_3094/g.8766  ORF Transcript_3094/g.8766 Transcript_3094/m.8766 type:complete len:411 (+) Transcript_3094:207-1439(+)
MVKLSVRVGLHDARRWWRGERSDGGRWVVVALQQHAQASCGELGLQRTVLGDLQVVGAAGGNVGKDGGIEGDGGRGHDVERLAEDAEGEHVHGAVVSAFGVATVPAHVVGVDVLLGLAGVLGFARALVVAAVHEDGVLDCAVPVLWADDGAAGTFRQRCGNLLRVADADERLEAEFVLVPAVVGGEEVAAHVQGDGLVLLDVVEARLHGSEVHSLGDGRDLLGECKASRERRRESSRQSRGGLDGVVAHLVEEGVLGRCWRVDAARGLLLAGLQELVQSAADSLVFHAAALASLHLDDESARLLRQGPQLDAEVVHVGGDASHAHEIILERVVVVVVLAAVLRVDGMALHELAQAARRDAHRLQRGCTVLEDQAGAQVHGMVHRDGWWHGVDLPFVWGRWSRRLHGSRNS